MLTLVRSSSRTSCFALHAVPASRLPWLPPKAPNIATLQVPSGFDVADNEIVKRLERGDLVITADIPLAAESIEKQALALNPRGELYTRDNIKARLNMRDFMDSLRGAGVDTGGPPPLNQNDRHAFAQQLDRLLAKHAATG